MAEIIHMKCRHCGEPYQNGSSSYCAPCNTYMAYRAMPLLLGMLLLTPMPPQAAPVASRFLRGRTTPYPHLNEIMD